MTGKRVILRITVLISVKWGLPDKTRIVSQVKKHSDYQAAPLLMIISMNVGIFM